MIYFWNNLQNYNKSFLFGTFWKIFDTKVKNLMLKIMMIYIPYFLEKTSRLLFYFSSTAMRRLFEGGYYSKYRHRGYYLFQHYRNAATIRGRLLFEVQRLLEEVRYIYHSNHCNSLHWAEVQTVTKEQNDEEHDGRGHDPNQLCVAPSGILQYCAAESTAVGKLPKKDAPKFIAPYAKNSCSEI